MGCIIKGLPDTELENLSIPMNNLPEIGKCDWNLLQMKLIVKGVARRNSLTVKTLASEDVVSLDLFLCGFSDSEIGQINMDTFNNSVCELGTLECPLPITEKLKELAVSAYGEIETWNSAQVMCLGNIMAALSVHEWKRLPLKLFGDLRSTCIPLIPIEIFASFSEEQLASLGPENAAMVTREQRAALNEDQLKALDGNLVGDLSRSQMGSGAPSVSIEGISAFLKPLLFLLLGFLLL